MEEETPKTIIKTQAPVSESAGDRFSSRKLIMTLLGLILIWLVYHVGVSDINHAVNDVRAGYITSMHNNFDYVAAAIILTFLGISGIIGVWNKTTQEVVTTGTQAVSQAINEIKKTDITQHIIQEGDPNAPAVRPFSQHAVEEK